MKKISLLLLGLIGLSTAYAGTVTSQKTITFATEATYPPFVSVSPQGKVVGFGVDVVNAVCKNMHAKCKVINVPFDTLIPGLELKKFDVVMGGIGITKAREKVVNFTQSYYQNAVIFVTASDIKLTLTKAGLKGKTIGVQGGSTFQQYLQAKYGSDITIKPYASNMQALLDLKSGRLDAVFIDSPVAKVWLSKQKTGQFVMQGKIYSQNFFGKGNGMAVNKHNTVLLKQLNQSLNKIKADGTLNQLVKHYFK